MRQQKKENFFDMDNIKILCHNINIEIKNNNMNHKMKLQPHPFTKIKGGRKNIEVRLYDEKRKKITLNDTITFWLEPELKESIKTKVIGLLHYPTFADLVNDFPAKNFGHPNKKHLLKTIYSFYTKKQEKKYTVLGIKIKKIK